MPPTTISIASYVPPATLTFDLEPSHSSATNFTSLQYLLPTYCSSYCSSQNPVKCLFQIHENIIQPLHFTFFLQMLICYISVSLADFLKNLYLWCGCSRYFSPFLFFLGRFLGRAWGYGTHSSAFIITNSCWTICRWGEHFLGDKDKIISF